jgi:hypothetical protein
LGLFCKEALPGSSSKLICLLLAFFVDGYGATLNFLFAENSSSLNKST